MTSRLDVALRIGASGLLLAAPSLASALAFEKGELSGNFDTTVSAGLQVRMEDPDDRQIGVANGGSSRSVNDDDGNLNYDKGDITSAPVKATHELQLKYHNFGLFSRASYFYDFENHDSDKLGRRGEDRLGAEFDLLDLFASARFKVLDRNLDLRLGKQVVNWGESSFIANGINAINPIDVSKLRQPGSEIKEALLPTPMLWGSYPLNDKLSAELLWLLAWDKTEIDPRGSFFSTNDVVSDDGVKAFAGSGRRRDDNSPPTPLAGPGANPAEAQLWADRRPDRHPDNGRDQYGATLRYFASWLNDTELGLYYLRYHSRTPIASVTRSGSPGAGPGGFPNPLGASTYNNVNGTLTYFAEYPEDIDLYGISFNTTGPYGIALQGEYSFRPNQPVQVEDIELLLAAVGLPNKVTGEGFTTLPDGPDPDTNPDVVPSAALVPAGTDLHGYRRVDMHQAQMTATKAFGPKFAAQQFLVIGEVGYTHLDLPNGLPFNGPGTNLPASQFTADRVSNGSTQKGEGYATRDSWGYRAVARLDYENAIGAVGMSPRLVFSHDVNGVSPSFNQGAKALTFGLGFSYLQRWQADLAYTSFFGGRDFSGTDPSPATGPVPPGQSPEYSTSANPLRDRDFLSVSLSYAF
ncbi:DUF1302 domain-containing protein [Solimonas sp. K1W22B-7]|uniref:DUF1302 domain-containing protein n=1 Tax=Solimonas sp. K1W22B-7 TaxID=2303331 RepID=UPI000E32FA5A|nr:DUF1302 domain-containing protein [Solimonas sp. K1W22B-7]AXQ31107.1 DUF1302 domain-containing protein [Solimonas sp. K1W22B-7]